MRSTVDGDGSQGWSRRFCWLVAVFAVCLAWGAAAQAQPYVYVANSGSSGVSQYDAMGGALSPLTPATVEAGPGPQGVAVSPDGKSVWVVNGGSNAVSQYDVGADGALTPKTPATVAASSGGIGLAVSPDGKSVYVTLRAFPTGTVAQYDVGAGGTLTPKSPATVPSATSPSEVAVSPDGKSVYVTNFLSDAVSQYDVGAGGALTPKSPATVATDGDPLGVAVSPDGESVYVTNFEGLNGVGGDTVSQYDVATDGALTPKNPATVGAGLGPQGVAVSADGKSVYVTNLEGGTVSQYDVGTGGALSPKTPATVAAGVQPSWVAVSPDGKSVYVTNSTSAGTVSQFNVGAGGALTPKTPATVTAGSDPQGIAVTPLPAVHPTSTGVSCSPRVFAPGDTTVCTATVTDTASSGQSTPTGTVSFTRSGTGRFLGSQCTLSGSGASASCEVFFTSFTRGGQGIEASYSGDAPHSASSGATIVLVALPASTSGCVVFGHGRITAANSDKASFRMLAAATPTRGVEFYRDNGSTSAFRLISTTFEALTCSSEAITASAFGTAMITGYGSVQYRVDVQLSAWRGGTDTYRIRLSNGYDSGAQPIRHGDVTILHFSSQHRHLDPNANHYKPGATPDGG